MSQYNTLKTAIADVIKTNGTNAITGAILQQSLLSMIDSLGAGYQMMGVAVPGSGGTDPGTPDQNVVYIAGPGTYTNFGGLTVAANEIAILSYNGTWHKQTFLSGLITRQLLDDGIVQLYDGTNPIYPRTKAAAVYFGNDQTDILKKITFTDNQIVLPDWKANTAYVIGNQCQNSGHYYRCTTAHTSGSTFDSTKWTEITDFGIGGPSIQTINIGSESNPIYQSCIKLANIGDTSSPNIGDIFYRTDTHRLLMRISTTSAPYFVGIPFIDGAIYTYKNELYVWDGANLVKAFDDSVLYQLVNLDLSNIRGGYIVGGNPPTWYGVSAGLTKHIVFPCVGGDTFIIKTNASKAYNYTFLKSYDTSVAPDLCEVATLVGMSTNREYTATAPSDAHYFYITIKDNTLVDGTPEYVKQKVLKTDVLTERVNTLESVIAPLPAKDLELDGKILAINNKIAGVNVDITNDVQYNNAKVWNAQLQLIADNPAFNAAYIDVSQYVGATLKVYTYGGSDGYQGFKLDDGTLYNVEHIPTDGYNKQREFVIPPRAARFYFSYATSLGITQKVNFVLSSIADDTIFQAEGGTIGTFNDVKTNRKKLSLFRKMLSSKIVDQYNRLVVSFNGDSILGSQLNDIDHSPEYDTGAYPPNMSKVIAARMFYDRYKTKFTTDDTQFRNLEHVDWVKTGFNVNKGKGSAALSFNEFESWGCASADDVAQITITGYKYYKLIWSRLNVLTETWECSVLVSVNSGAFQTPTQAGLTLANTIGTIENHEEMQVYSICELNPENTYVFKIQPTSNYANVKLWGCEYWNNPRLDVVVMAFSGSWTRAQVQRMMACYGASWHTPKIIIYDVLAINDNTYFNSGNLTISQWMQYNTELLDHAKQLGIPVLVIANHKYGLTLPALASSYARQREDADIDIPVKLSVVPPESDITGPDGLHLSNYGNAYFFEELERIFG